MRKNPEEYRLELEMEEEKSSSFCGCFCPCLPNKIKKPESGIAWRRKNHSTKLKHPQRRSSTPPTVRPTLLLPPMTCTGENNNSTTAPVVTTRVQQSSEDNSQNFVIYHTTDNNSHYAPRPEPSAPSPGHLFYNSEDHSDITFIVGPEEWRFPAHSFILNRTKSTLSSLLKSAQGLQVESIATYLNSVEMSPGQKPPLVLKLPKLQPEVFEQILRYIYTGQVSFSSIDTTLRLLYPSQAYHLPLLTTHCLHHISKNVNIANVLNVLSHLLCPEVYHPAINSSSGESNEESPLDEDCHNNDNERNELVFKCFLIVDRHADEVLQSEMFETLEHELMVEIIKRDTLEVSSEAVVFDSVMRWACRACKKQRKELTSENKCTVLGKALFLVRYLTMTSEEFLRGPVSQGVLNKDKEILLSHLSNADSTTKIPLPERWNGWKISVKRQPYRPLLPIASPQSELVTNTSDITVSPSNSIQPVKSDRKKKSMSKKLLNGVGDLVICVIQLLD